MDSSKGQDPSGDDGVKESSKSVEGEGLEVQGQGVTSAVSRVDQILAALNSNEEFPSHLRRPKEPLPSPEALAEELLAHPMFATQETLNSSNPGELSPLLQGLADLKYSPDQDPTDLAKAYKSDGLFQFKLGKYRIAKSIFTEALKHGVKPEGEEEGRDAELISTLYNNRGVCEFHLENYRSAFEDFKKAVGERKEETGIYAKAMKKGVECVEKLEIWGEGKQWVEKVKEKFPQWEDWDRIDGIIKKGERRALVAAHRSRAASRDKDKSKSILLHKIETVGVKMSSTDFLEEQEMSHRVKLVEDTDTLHWPVILFYPEFGQSDFIEEWDENDTFLPHLEKILVEERPPWDRNNEYTIDKIKIGYVRDTVGGWEDVDVKKKLGSVLGQPTFRLPPNGIPGFLILTDNAFSNMFRDRMN